MTENKAKAERRKRNKTIWRELQSRDMLPTEQKNKLSFLFLESGLSRIQTILTLAYQRAGSPDLPPTTQGDLCQESGRGRFVLF